jgi:hypothetical protein
VVDRYRAASCILKQNVITGVIAAALVPLAAALASISRMTTMECRTWAQEQRLHPDMQAMGNMDSDEMLARMRAILAPEGSEQMLDHMAEHRGGGGAGPGMDGMMHQLMDGMMQQMPADQNNVMPMMLR